MDERWVRAAVFWHIFRGNVCTGIYTGWITVCRGWQGLKPLLDTANILASGSYRQMTQSKLKHTISIPRWMSGFIVESTLFDIIDLNVDTQRPSSIWSILSLILIDRGYPKTILHCGTGLIEKWACEVLTSSETHDGHSIPGACLCLRRIDFTQNTMDTRLWNYTHKRHEWAVPSSHIDRMCEIMVIRE